MTDQRDQRPWLPPTGGGRQPRPGAPSDPDGTGVWRPSWVGDPESTDHIPRVPPTTPTTRTPQREPELITHREPLPPAPPAPRGHAPAPTRPGPGPGPGRRQGEALTPEAEAALRRSRIWRRVRRICYAGAAGLVLGPILLFLIGYAMIDVPSFAAVANRQQQPVTIMYSDGKTELATITPAEGNRINVKYDDVPEHVRNAVLAAEDRTFFTNPGFDPKGIARAIWKQLRGQAGGGSGITQQYVKVATNQDELTLTRKFREVVIATKLSRDTPKE
ncbi:MAG TPA: biosynthetic peptidoglycan transglycosylase, partial [Pseudonocardiaceae bacterium]